MADTPIRLEMPDSLWVEMLAHLQANLPEEACGLLGGAQHGGVAGASLVLPIENELHSPVRFRMAPSDQIKAFYAIEHRGLALVAVFHSHPNGPDHPSAADRVEFAYPGVLTLICVPHKNSLPGRSLPDSSGWLVCAFYIDGVLDPHAPVYEIALVRIPAENHPSAQHSLPAQPDES